jgi:DNA-binding transcriptional MerR regulator
MLNYGLYSIVKALIMLIQELVTQSGLSKDTIRYYEKIGLLDSAYIQRSDNGYRQYSSQALQALKVVAELKSFGFSLREIQELLALSQSNANACPGNAPKIREKIQVLDQKIAELTRYRQSLYSTLVDCLDDCANRCQIEQSLKSLKAVSV